MDAGDEYDELDELAASTAARLAVVLTDLAGGIARSTASRAAWADGSAGGARPTRAHQVPMAALSAALGIIVAPPGSTPGGWKASSAQAWRHVRS